MYRSYGGSFNLISDSIKDKIDSIISKKYELDCDFIWKHTAKGFINDNYLISEEDKEPLAVCKIFKEDEEIYQAKQRFEREVFALEMYGGMISPEIIWKKEPIILVYNYIKGQELIHLEINKEIEVKLKEVVEQVHRIARNNKRVKAEAVTSFYQKIIYEYKKSKLKYPVKLIDELEVLIHNQQEILDQFQEQLTFAHGDLVPPNFIFSNNQFILIDWEFFRPELIFFDYQYFNYYAKAHMIPIEIECEKKVKDHYYRLVDVLEKLWRYGYLRRKNKINFDI